MGKQYEDMTDAEKAKYDKWMKRSEMFNKAGSGMQGGGVKIAGCGCLLTLIITIPILILLFFIF